MQTTTQLDSTSTLNLKRLFFIRNIVISCEIIAIIVSIQILTMALPIQALFTILGLYAGLNIFTWFRIKNKRLINSREFAYQLSFDTLIFALLLYHVGGYTNPFVSLFLLPLVISAAILPQRYILFMASLTIICYTVLMFYYTPIPHMHMSHDGHDFDLHVLGMWFSFLLSVGLIVFFVVKMANSLRERDQQLAKAREKALQDEHLVTLGTLATGAAHELGTPLATMAVLAKEITHDHNNDPDLIEKAEIFRQQIDRCKSIISEISATTGQTRAEGGSRIAIDSYLEGVIEQWQQLRPTTQAHYSGAGVKPTPTIFADKTLTQALINLLNNAADASIEQIDISANWNEDQLKLDIHDHGPGISPSAKQAIGTPFFTTKEEGYGLGLYLSNAVIERYGGQLTLTNRNEGGVTAQVIIPLR